MRLPSVQTRFIALTGGLDKVSPQMTMKEGTLTDSLNFDADTYGGYRRPSGYERFDGRPRPSDAIYYLLPCLIQSVALAAFQFGAFQQDAFQSFASGLWAVGDTVTGQDSGATGVIIAEYDEGLIVTKVSGTFIDGENLTVGGFVVATMNSDPEQRGFFGDTMEEQLEFQATNDVLAADAYRADIQAPSGSGQIRGVWIYNGDVYCFRNNAGGTACVMYKATAGGWSVVTTPALSPSGRYEFVNYNFGGDTFKMYGCDGVNKAFEFDGTTFTQITTGMAVDTPSHIAAHQNHLFLTFGHSLQHSGINDPTTWSVVSGGAELSMGETITNLSIITGNDSSGALLITTRNSTRVLYGTSSANWKLVVVAPDTGALSYSSQVIGTPFAADDRGIVQLAQSQAFGNFEQASLSHPIRPYLLERLTLITASTINRERNQYRLFFSDDSALYMTLSGNKVVGLMPMLFKVSAVVACSAEINGRERTFFGGDDGKVYELDVGPNFDGEEIEAYIKTGYMHMGSLRMRKTFRRMALEVTGTSYSRFQVFAEYDFGNVEVDTSTPQAVRQNSEVAFTAGRWDNANWDEFFWDGTTLLPAIVALAGQGENISLTAYSFSKIHSSFTINGAVIHYTPRRLAR